MGFEISYFGEMNGFCPLIKIASDQTKTSRSTTCFLIIDPEAIAHCRNFALSVYPKNLRREVPVAFPPVICMENLRKNLGYEI